MSSKYTLAALVVFGLPYLWLGVFLTDKIGEVNYQTAKTYNTAVQATDAESFNYAVDSRQGNVLATGGFTTNTPVSRPELLNQYHTIKVVKYRYNQHTEQYECGTEDSPQTCTRTYYSWDIVDEDTLTTPTTLFHGKEYPTELFSIRNLRWLDCSEITQNCSGGFMYPKKSFFTSVGDIRYAYKVKDTSFIGTILVNTSNGTIKPVWPPLIKVEDKSIEDVLKSVNSSFGDKVFLLIWIVTGIAAAFFYVTTREQYT